MERKGLQVFTHGDDGDDWTRLYPYTVVAYQLGKRIYREFRDVRDVLESFETDAYSANLVITPNGETYRKAEFIDAYEIAVGLTVPAPQPEVERATRRLRP